MLNYDPRTNLPTIGKVSTFCCEEDAFVIQCERDVEDVRREQTDEHYDDYYVFDSWADLRANLPSKMTQTRG